MIPAIMTCKSLRNSFIMIVMMTVKSFWLIIKQDHEQCNGDSYCGIDIEQNDNCHHYSDDGETDYF